MITFHSCLLQTGRERKTAYTWSDRQGGGGQGSRQEGGGSDGWQRSGGLAQSSVRNSSMSKKLCPSPQRAADLLHGGALARPPPTPANSRRSHPPPRVRPRAIVPRGVPRPVAEVTTIRARLAAACAATPPLGAACGDRGRPPPPPPPRPLLRPCRAARLPPSSTSPPLLSSSPPTCAPWPCVRSTQGSSGPARPCRR